MWGRIAVRDGRLRFTAATEPKLNVIVGEGHQNVDRLARSPASNLIQCFTVVLEADIRRVLPEGERFFTGTWTLKRRLAVTSSTIDLSTVCRQHSRSVVPETAWLRGHHVVLVNESAQHVVTTDVLGCRGSGGGCSGGHVELDTSMRTLLVVVADILTKGSFEVTLAQNEQPVEALCSDGFGALHLGPRFLQLAGPRVRCKWREQYKSLAIALIVRSGWSASER